MALGRQRGPQHPSPTTSTLRPPAAVASFPPLLQGGKETRPSSLLLSPIWVVASRPQALRRLLVEPADVMGHRFPVRGIGLLLPPLPAPAAAVGTGAQPILKPCGEELVTPVLAGSRGTDHLLAGLARPRPTQILPGLRPPNHLHGTLPDVRGGWGQRLLQGPGKTPRRSWSAHPPTLHPPPRVSEEEWKRGIPSAAAHARPHAPPARSHAPSSAAGTPALQMCGSRAPPPPRSRSHTDPASAPACPAAASSSASR